MRYSSLIVVFAVVLAPVAQAACFVCDEVVELTDEMANCFTESLPNVLERLEGSATGRATVNMAECSDEAPDARRREGLIGMGRLPTTATPRTKSVYVLDTASVLCLRDLIAGLEGPIDPTITFDLFESCSDG